MKRALGIVLVMLIAGYYSAMAQLSVKATTDRNKVALGEQFQVNYEVGGNGNFTPPNFKDFQVLGQSTMSGGGMTLYVNGKLMSGGNQSTTHSYTLAPKAVGKFLGHRCDSVGPTVECAADIGARRIGCPYAEGDAGAGRIVIRRGTPSRTARLRPCRDDQRAGGEHQGRAEHQLSMAHR